MAATVSIEAGESIQSAYNTLPSDGGAIRMGAGRYDVGNGILLNRTKPAAFVGSERWRRRFGPAFVPATGNILTGTVLYSSVTTPNPFFRMTLPLSFFNAEGFVWRNLSVELGPSSAFVQGDNLSYSLIDDCIINETSGNGVLLRLGTYDCFSLGTQHGDRASFNRVFHGNIIGGAPGLYTSLGAGASTTFRHAVGKPFGGHQGNVIAYGHGQIEMYGETGTLVMGNNVEGARQIWDMCSQCLSVDNGGEANDLDFITLSRSSGNFIADQGHSTAQTGVLARFQTGSIHNLLMAAPLSQSLPFKTGAYGENASEIEDTDATRRNYYIRPGAYHLGTAEFPTALGALNPNEETDTAQTVTPNIVQPLAQVEEVDNPLGVGVVEDSAPGFTQVLHQVGELETSQTVTPRTRSEFSDTAAATTFLTAFQRVVLPARETSEALGLDALILEIGVETDEAQVVAMRQRLDWSTPAVATTESIVVVPEFTIDVALIEEIEEAFALLSAEVHVLTGTSESDTARAIGIQVIGGDVIPTAAGEASEAQRLPVRRPRRRSAKVVAYDESVRR